MSESLKDRIQSLEREIAFLRKKLSGKNDLQEDLIAAKEKAEFADNLKSAYLANMSHEMRTPLNSILGFADLLNSEKLSKKELDIYTGIIMNNGNQLLRIVDDITDFARLEAGKMEFILSEVNLNQLLDDVFQYHKAEAKKKRLKFIVNTENKEASFTTDSLRLKQIFDNLIKNAIQFTFKGQIEMGYHISDNRIKFYVKDTGIGIDKAHHQIIFDRFRRVEDDSTIDFGGTGLGLSIVKGLVELLGGEIKLESGPGKGSTFMFSFDYNDKKPSVELSSEMNIELDGDLIHKLKILIAEDEHDNFMFLKFVFNKYHVPVLHANNGKEAIALFKKAPHINLIIMDLKMPIMDGYQAVKKIRQIDPDIKILALTAYACNNDKKAAITAGCNDYLSKPVKRIHLIDKINQMFKS